MHCVALHAYAIIVCAYIVCIYNVYAVNFFTIRLPVSFSFSLTTPVARTLKIAFFLAPQYTYVLLVWTLAASLALTPLISRVNIDMAWLSIY